MRIKLGGDEGSRPFLSGVSFEGTRDDNSKDRSEELEDSEFGYSLVSEGGSEIGF